MRTWVHPPVLCLLVAFGCSKPAPESGATSSPAANPSASVAPPPPAPPPAEKTANETPPAPVNSAVVAKLDPQKLTEKAPNVYKAKFNTSKGSFVVKVTRDWAPTGADRFYNLIKSGFYNDTR